MKVIDDRVVCGVGCCVEFVFFFKQKTAYEMRISDWSSDVCSSDLHRMEAPIPLRKSNPRRAWWRHSGLGVPQILPAWPTQSRSGEPGMPELFDRSSSQVPRKLKLRRPNSPISRV